MTVVDDVTSRYRGAILRRAVFIVTDVSSGISGYGYAFFNAQPYAEEI